MDNRVWRRCEAATSGNTTYTATTVRPYNNVTTIGLTRVTFVLGLDATVDLTLIAQMNNGGTVGLGLDTTTGFTNVMVINFLTNNVRAGSSLPAFAVTAGYHYGQSVQTGSGTSGNFGLSLIAVAIMG